MAVARGDAVVVTNDGRRVAADTLVAYTSEAPAAPGGAAPQAPRRPRSTAGEGADDPLAASGKLQKVEAFGNVSVRTATETVHRRPRRLCARYRHRPARRPCAHHARPQPAQRARKPK